MTVLRADYFDGKTSDKQPVTMLFDRGRLRVVGRAVALDFDPRRVRRSLPVGAAPRWFYLPGGGACVTTDVAAVDRVARKRRYERALEKWESRPLYAGLAAALVGVVFWLIVDYGVPAIAEQVATRIPIEAETALGRESLEGLDRYLMRPTRLPAERQRVLREKLAEMVRTSGSTTPYELQFRSSPAVGPNAFALPSGIVVVTDELVKLAKGDREVLGVLAHELGHIHHRHTMRRLLEASATALVIAGVTGDLASASSLAASAPALLLQTKYSRGNEREADSYAIEMLRKAGINPRVLGDILARMEGKAGGQGIPTFMASHPPTEERVALSRAGSPEAEPEFAPDTPKVAALDPAQRELLALVQAKDYDGLERVLGGRLAAFDADPATLPALLNAFESFGKVPDGARTGLEAWAKRAPSSQATSLALGRLHLQQALDARGLAPLAETPGENLAAMKTSLGLARAELERALGIAPRAYLPRQFLMVVARLGGDRTAELAHYAEAVKLAPKSVELRLEHMNALTPGSGGSIDAMHAFLEESRRDLTESDVARLAARIPAERARERVAAGDWTLAVKLLDESIALDPSASTLCERSRAQAVLKRPAEAIADIERALALVRDDRRCLRDAVRAAELASTPDDVVRILSLVIESDPAAADAYNQRGAAYEFLGRLDLARKDYTEAARLGDDWAAQQLEKTN